MALPSQMTNLSQEHNNPWGLDQEWEIVFMGLPRGEGLTFGHPTSPAQGQQPSKEADYKRKESSQLPQK